MAHGLRPKVIEYQEAFDRFVEERKIINNSLEKGNVQQAFENLKRKAKPSAKKEKMTSITKLRCECNANFNPWTAWDILSQTLDDLNFVIIELPLIYFDVLP